MFASQLIIAVTLIAFAAWLHWNEVNGWPNEPYDRSKDADYLKSRMRSRRRVNFLFGTCGILIVIAAFAGPGRVFIACWMIVSLALMSVFVFAALDFIRTRRYDKKKMSELRKQLLSEFDSLQP